MANYISMGRTNYFAVNDEAKYAELFCRLDSEYGVQDISKHQEDGSILHGFYSEAYITFELAEEEKNKLKQEIIEENKGHIFYDEDGNIAEDPMKLNAIYIKEGDPTIPYNAEFDNLEAIFDADCWADYCDNLPGIYEFAQQLQKILPKGECFVYEEIGHEKLRYLTGYVIMATHDHITDGSLNSFVRDQSEEWNVCPTDCAY